MDQDELLGFATRAVAAGNLAAAEIACRDLLDFEPRDAATLHLLGFIAAKVGAREQAEAYFQSALEIEPDNARIRENLEAVQKMPAPRLPPGERYLLIKSWGYGFWSDIVEVLGSLLFAETTGRTAVIYWGHDSLFSGLSGQDAFVSYFEPVSNHTLEQLAQIRGANFFPPRWHAGNLTESGLARWEGRGSRAGAVYFLNRPETIAVSDFHIGVVNVMPWIPAFHPMHGKSLEEIYRYLTAKYLRPRPSILAAADAFFDTHLADASFVAVHVRGSDKALEDPDLEATNRALFSAIDSVDRSWRIFLMTDDVHWLARMKAIYGTRIVVTDCQRTSTTEGLHYASATDPLRAGQEIMVDTYLALRAQRFIGNGRSNVSAIIAMLKDWAPGDLTLIGRSLLMDRNLHLYEVPTFSKA
jgi:tetratricopeptide (TPR) repeat protein